MNDFLKDLRFGLRQLASKPGFAAAAILTMALGIGANTAVFSVLSGYLFKPLPYPDASKLAVVNVKAPELRAGDFPISLPIWRTIQQQTDAFSASAVYLMDDWTLQADGRAQYVYGLITTPSLFSVLGVQPLIGSSFTKGNTEAGNNQVVVISYPLWRSTFGADPDVIGKQVKIEGDVYKVIGVMPKGFAFPDRNTSFWLPRVFDPERFEPSRFLNLNWRFIGRRNPAATMRAAELQAQQAVQRWAETNLPAHSQDVLITQKLLDKDGFQLRTQSYHRELVGSRPATLWLLQGAVLLILLITCVNVANLLLSRILGRSHEMAMRSTLGATRGVLARQLLGEALCLTVPGGLIGVALAWLGLHFLIGTSLGPGSSIFSIGLDWRVALFALGCVLFTAAVVSILPIRHLAKTDLQGLLQEGSRTSGGGHGAKRIRNALVVAELTLATGLLAMAGLLLHSFMNIEAVNPGFRKDHVLIALVAPSPNSFSSRKELTNIFQHIAKRVETLPGVVRAGISDGLPLGGMGFQQFSIPGRESTTAVKPPEATLDLVSPGYFEALGIPVLRDRNFDQRDAAASRVIVDAAFVNKYFPDADPIGRKIKSGENVYSIVGVAPAVRNQGLSQTTPTGAVYMNIFNVPSPDMYLLIHTTLPPRALIKPLKQLMSTMTPATAISEIHTMGEHISQSMGDRQATMTLLLAFGGVALALAIVGVYAVMSYAVGQRRAECGVRLALGARPGDLSWLVLKDGFRLLVVGLVLGLGVAVLFGYLLSAKLYGVSPFDPITLIGSAVVLCAITLIACWLPARRAAKLDPSIAMMEQ